eukprot:TsM_000966200 transcript=TsM_000966200 gene=TsM_000966200
MIVELIKFMNTRHGNADAVETLRRYSELLTTEVSYYACAKRIAHHVNGAAILGSQKMQQTNSIQSTAKMRAMSLIGRPTEVSTITIVTRPALGTAAAPMAANVAVMLDEDTATLKLLLDQLVATAHKRMSKNIPNSNELTNRESVFINLGDKDASNSFVKSSTIHVDCSTDRENKASHPSIYAQIFFEASRRNTKCVNLGALHQKSIQLPVHFAESL